jgi:AbiV family abortive infection protein
VHENFLNLYNASLKNANALLREAEILFEAEKYARAYALAFTALEEISKSQLAADVFTGLIPEADFKGAYRDHRKKIDRMAWATEDAKGYLAMPEEDYLDVQDVSFANRQSAMYVGFDGGKAISPSEVIGRDQARSVIHTVTVALERIFEVTEYMGQQIGTKGFMK